MKAVVPTDDEIALFSMEPGEPNWTDGCQHEEDSFLGKFKVLNRLQHTIETYDLYVFRNKDRDEVCIRFGNDNGDYISPGNLGEFLLRTDHTNEVYWRAAQIILHFGNVNWKAKDKV